MAVIICVFLRAVVSYCPFLFLCRALGPVFPVLRFHLLRLLQAFDSPATDFDLLLILDLFRRQRSQAFSTAVKEV